MQAITFPVFREIVILAHPRRVLYPHLLFLARGDFCISSYGTMFSFMVYGMGLYTLFEHALQSKKRSISMLYFSIFS